MYLLANRLWTYACLVTILDEPQQDKKFQRIPFWLQTNCGWGTLNSSESAVNMLKQKPLLLLRLVLAETLLSSAIMSSMHTPMHEYRKCMAADMTVSAGVITSRKRKTLCQTVAYHDAPYSGDGIDAHSPFSKARWEMTPVRSSSEWTCSPGDQRSSEVVECMQLGTKDPQGSLTCLHQKSLMAKTFALQPSASICCYTQRDCCCMICSTLTYGQAQHGLNIVYPRLHSV